MRWLRGAAGIGLAALVIGRLSPEGAAAGPPARSTRPQIVRVGVELENPASSFAAYASTMIAEADAIWRPYAVAVVLLNASEARDIASCDVRMTVAFAAATGTARTDASHPGLGAIWFQESGLPSRAVTVDPSMVDAKVHEAAVNGRRLDRWPPGLASLVTGRALGRVLAHELGHFLLSSPAHARSGLMRAAFDGRQLAGWDRRPFALEAESVPRLRARLARLDTLDQPLVSASEDRP